MPVAAGRRMRRTASRTLVAGVLCATGALPATARADDTTPPSRPGAIAVSKLTATSASLSWGASHDDVAVEGYRVYRGPEGAADSALQLIATTDAVNSYAARNLFSGRGYRFGVTAIDAAGNESPMSSVTLTTLADSSDTTAPAAPAGVKATPFSDSRVDVTWGRSAADDVAGYQVLRDGTPIATVELPNGLYYSDNGLAASSPHAYAVRAVDSAGNVSVSSNAGRATTLGAGTATIARGPYLSNVTGTSAVISWWTNIPTAGRVSWGTASAAEHAADDPAGTVYHHSVTIGGLVPGSMVRYQVGDGNSVASGVASFPTAPPPGQPFSFAAIGDFGGNSPGETQNAAHIAAAGTSFIQTVGDNVYPAAGDPDPDFAHAYSDFDQRFFKPFGPAVRGQAFFPANGNKEYYDEGAFWKTFPMPGDNHAWYSYDWGDAHILVLDSELPFAPGTPQYDFARSDLSGHQGAVWRIVALQRPPYSSSSANASSVAVQQYLVPLFEAQHVQLVLSGNSHNYERTYPLIDGARAAGGITYVVTGGGGNGFNAFNLAQPAWSAYREATTYEYLEVSVSPAAIDLAAIGADSAQVLDSARIAPGTAAPPPGSSGTPRPSGGDSGTPTPPALPAPPPGGAPAPPPSGGPAPVTPTPVVAQSACAVRTRGHAGNDRLAGTRRGDRLTGRGGNDLLLGFGGADCLFGGAGRDVLRGGTGSDRLWGGSGNDRLSGGTGSDRLNGGRGHDWLSGGSGADAIDARDGAPDVVDCGSGRDIARVDRRDTVRRCERVMRGAT